MWHIRQYSLGLRLSVYQRSTAVEAVLPCLLATLRLQSTSRGLRHAMRHLQSLSSVACVAPGGQIHPRKCSPDRPGRRQRMVDFCRSGPYAGGRVYKIGSHLGDSVFRLGRSQAVAPKWRGASRGARSWTSCLWLLVCRAGARR
jgi:hypothetical protein